MTVIATAVDRKGGPIFVAEVLSESGNREHEGALLRFPLDYDARDWRLLDTAPAPEGPCSPAIAAPGDSWVVTDDCQGWVPANWRR